MHLYKIIGQDIDTLKQLVEYLGESANVKSAELELALRKTTDIYNELLMLKKEDKTSFVKINSNSSKIEKDEYKEEVINVDALIKGTNTETLSDDVELEVVVPVAEKKFVTETIKNTIEADISQVQEQKLEPENITEAEQKSEFVSDIDVEDKLKKEVVSVDEDVDNRLDQDDTILEIDVDKLIGEGVVMQKSLKKENPNIETSIKPDLFAAKDNGILNDVRKSEVIADKFTNNLSVNDILSDFKNNKDLASRLKESPINNLQKAVKINDRIWYIKELFNGDSDLYKEVIEEIESQDDLSSALNLIFERFSWDQEKDSTVSFLELVFRRFSSK